MRDVHNVTALHEALTYCLAQGVMFAPDVPYPRYVFRGGVQVIEPPKRIRVVLDELWHELHDQRERESA